MTRIDQDALVADLLAMVRIDSESGHERALADWLRPRLEALGGTVRIDEAAKLTGGDCGNLIAQFPGDTRPALLLSAHLDTVAPGRGIVPVVADGMVRGSGGTVLGADDKAGIAAILAALRTVPVAARPPVDVLLTVSEEAGLMGAKAVRAEQLRARAGYVLDAEGTVGTVVTSAPAHEHYHVAVRGKAAHAGIAPEQGSNAIAALARALAQFPQGRLAEDTTANIGRTGGGVARNIVAAEAWADGEVRSHRDDELRRQIAGLHAITTATAAATGTIFTLTTKRQYERFAVQDSHPLVVAVRTALPTVRGPGGSPRELRIKASNGGSDANVLAAAGVEAVVLAAAFEKVHTPEEYVVLEELVASAELLAAILRSWNR